MDSEPHHAGAWNAVFRHARRHRAFFWRGVGLSVCGVAAQLSIPWPLRELLVGDPNAAWRESLQGWLTPSLLLVALFLLAMVAAGFFDFVQRVQFARFAIAWSRDLRAAAHGAVLEGPLPGSALDPGDLVARLIADVARFKAAVKQALIYVATNAILFAGACVVIWWVEWTFGVLFLVAFLTAALVAALGARRTYREFLGYRASEGRVAGGVAAGGKAIEGDLAESGRLEAAEMRQQGGAAWTAHALVGAVVFAIVVVGSRGAAAGDVDPGAILLFLAYALFLSKPLVRLTRHGARSGKLVAAALRLGTYLVPGSEDSAPPLARDLRVRWQKNSVDLAFRAGTRVAITGAPGSGGGDLFRALTGRRSDGAIEWDGSELTDAASELAARATLVPRDPSWSFASLRAGLGLPAEGPPLPEARTVLEELGIVDLVERRGGGPLSSSAVSRSERVKVALARGLLRGRSVLFLEHPCESLDDASAAGLARLLSRERRLLVVRTYDAAWLPGLDRVVHLEGGRVVRDGRPAAREREVAT